MAEPDTVAVTVRLPAQQRDALDILALALGRDRSDLVSEAVAQLLETREGWTAHLRQGLLQADADEVASLEEVAAAFAPQAGPPLPSP